MIPKQFFRLVAAALLLVQLSACAAPTPQPTPSPTGTPTPLPSPTPTPTLSPAEPVQEGDRLLLQSNFEGALAAYRRAIEIDESHGPAYTGISRVYLSQGMKLADALEEAQKGAELSPGSAFAQAVLARALLHQDEFNQAVAAAEKAAELDPESAAAQAALALAYLSENHFDQAQAAAEAAYDLDPQSPQALYALGQSYESTADFGRALAAYRRAAELEPQYADWQVVLGDFWLFGEKYEQAADAYEEALGIAPDHLPALLGQVYLALARYDFNAAQEQLDHLLTLAPEEADVHAALGYLHLDQGEYADALAQFRKALQLGPMSFYIKNGIGTVYLHQAECELARSHFQQMSADFPNLSFPPAMRGSAELCLGDASKALTYFREAIEKNPFSDKAQFWMGDAYSSQGRWDEAQDAYLEALRVSQAPASIHSGLANMLEQQGLVDDAQSERTIALEINPYLPDTYFSQGLALFFQGQTDEAMEAVKKAVDLDPADNTALRLLGIIYTYQDQTDLAVKSLQAVLDKAPEDALSHLHLGYAYRDQGKYSQAKKELETYLALIGETPEESSNPTIPYLIDALDLGYLLPDDEALDELDVLYQAVFGKRADTRIEEADGARTLTLTLPVGQAEQDAQALTETLGYAGFVAALVSLRIDPPVDNGLMIRLTQGGRALYTADATPAILKMYANGLLTLETFIQRLEISQVKDTGQPESFEKIARNVAAERGLALQTAIPVETLDPEGIEISLQDSVDEQVRTSLQKDAALLTLLGVITPSLDLEETWVNLYSEQISGFYDPEALTIYIVERDGQPDIEPLVLAHEAVHALQDQHFDLDALDDPQLNDDQRLAIDALIEGDAMLADVFYAQSYIPLLDQLETASQVSGLESEVLESAPHFISTLSTFPYFNGLDYVYAIYERDGWEGVNQAYQEWPLSTEHILHPERYFDGDQPQTVSLPEVASASGWQAVDEDVLGELGLQLTLAEHLGPAASAAAAEGWGGDRYLLLENESGAHALLLQTVWDSQEEAEQFWHLYRTYMEHRPGYSQVFEKLVGELPDRRWSGANDHVYAVLEKGSVTIVIAPSPQAVQELVELFK